MLEVRDLTWENGEVFLIGTEHGPWKMADGIIMQFTGLTDANGKEIYEGDMVEYFTEECVKIQAPVFFDAGAFSVRESHEYYPCLYEIVHKATIIGNIHQNPELLD
jgi:uncharacterized phage protein (TIGR01671 family)